MKVSLHGHADWWWDHVRPERLISDEPRWESILHCMLVQIQAERARLNRLNAQQAEKFAAAAQRDLRPSTAYPEPDLPRSYLLDDFKYIRAAKRPIWLYRDYVSFDDSTLHAIQSWLADKTGLVSRPPSATVTMLIFDDDAGEPHGVDRLVFYIKVEMPD